MGFNYGYEKKKFDSRWKRLEVEYCDAGMSEEQIAAMKEYDWAWFCSQRVFQNHTQPIPCEQYDEVCGQSQLFRKFASLGVKDTSSRPPKDLGGTLRRTSKTTLWSYDSRASGDRNVPIARGAWQMWRVNFSKSDTMRWQLRLPAHSCDFESNNHIFDRKGDHLWTN